MAAPSRLLATLVTVAVVPTMLTAVAATNPADAAPRPLAPATVFTAYSPTPAEFVGGGLSYVLPASQAPMHLSDGYPDLVRLTVDTDPAWQVTIQDPTGRRLSKGRHRTNTDDPNAYILNVTGNGRGCGSSTGWVTIRDIAYPAGTASDADPTRVDATFTHTCSFDSVGALTGQIAWRSTLPLAAPSGPAVLRPGQTLRAGQVLSSTDGAGGDAPSVNDYTLTIRNGQLVLIRRFHPFDTTTTTTIWSTPTRGSGADRARMLPNGILQLQTPAGRVVWQTPTARTVPGSFLLLQSDGALVVHGPRYQPVWAARTDG